MVRWVVGSILHGGTWTSRGPSVCTLCSGTLGLLPVPLAAQSFGGARCSSVVRAFAHGAMGRRIDPSWGGPIELFLVPASAPRLV